jgi:hypothetical protein
LLQITSEMKKTRREVKRERKPAATVLQEFQSYEDYLKSFLPQSEEASVFTSDDPIAFGTDLADLSLKKLEKLLVS